MTALIVALQEAEQRRLPGTLVLVTHSRYSSGMEELKLDRPVPMTEEEDAATLAAIDEGAAQLDSGQGIPLEDIRREVSKRCSK